MKIHCLMHVPFEDAASIGRWAKDRGHTLNYTRFFGNELPPKPDDFDMFAVMGGPMNIYEYDAYPWLKTEKRFLSNAINAGKKILGVCLGAQLLADCLGVSITANPLKEIGWHPITLTEAGQDSQLFDGMPNQIDVFHWHGDTFSLPPGAVHLAESAACTNQAFLFESHVLGLQFHMEYTTESIEKMLTHCAEELVDAPWIQSSEVIRSGCDKIPQATQYLYTLLDAFTAL